MTTSNVAIASISARTYSGIYLRNNLASKGTIPAQPPLNLCPDIIHSDSEVPPSQFASQQSWQQMYGVDPAIGAANYYYVRGLNGSNAADTGKMALYWAPAQVFNFPSAWKRNTITTATGSETTAVSAPPGNIAVGADPFVWTPSSPAYGSSYFNFVCQSTDAENPNLIPAVGSWLDLANLLSNNPGFGFRNTAIVDGSAATWTHRQILEVPATFSSAQLQVELSGHGFAGTKVGLLCDAFTPSGNVVTIDPVTVPGDGVIIGTPVNMEPGYKTSLAVTCWNSSAPPLKPGSTLTLTMTYPVPSGPDLEFAMSNGLLTYQHALSAESVKIGPTPVALVSTITFIVGASLQSAQHR